jgi:threonine/homoserine/homoserine lactone efflux protein
MDPQLAAFLAIAVVVCVTPGPDMLLVLRNTVAGGRLVGAATVGGVIVGILGWSVVAVAGLAAVLAASATAFAVLKLAGAAYLVWLGIAAIRHAGAAAEVPGHAARSLGHAAVQGFLSAALNPKLGVFFLTLLPQFSDPVGAPARSLGFALLFAATGLVWLLVFTALVGSLAAILARPTVRRRIGQATGVVFIGLGLRVATER